MKKLQPLTSAVLMGAFIAVMLLSGVAHAISIDCLAPHNGHPSDFSVAVEREIVELTLAEQEASYETAGAEGSGCNTAACSFVTLRLTNLNEAFDLASMVFKPRAQLQAALITPDTPERPPNF